MTVTTDRQWRLSPAAEGQMAERGIALSELYRLLRQPQLRMPGYEPDEERLQGYGLIAAIAGSEVRAVEIDGASAENAGEWAVERAAFGDGQVDLADALVRSDAEIWATSSSPGLRSPRERLNDTKHAKRRGRGKGAHAPTYITHVLDRVHPALREEITRQVAGDFSRLVIHSPTRVTIAEVSPRG